MKTFCNALPNHTVFRNEDTLFTTMIRPLIFLLLLSIPMVSQAQERTFGNGTLPEFLSLYDVDRSGGLSAEELQALRLDRNQRKNTVRKRWDTDGDGKISDAEREAAKAAIKATIEARRSLRFDEVDRDTDGFLTMEEFRRIVAVTQAENATPGISARLYLSLDIDVDGKVSKREFLRRLELLPIDAGMSPVPLPKPHPRIIPPPEEPAKPDRPAIIARDNADQ